MVELLASAAWRPQEPDGGGIFGFSSDAPAGPDFPMHPATQRLALAAADADVNLSFVVDPIAIDYRGLVLVASVRMQGAIPRRPFAFRCLVRLAATKRGPDGAWLPWGPPPAEGYGWMFSAQSRSSRCRRARRAGDPRAGRCPGRER
jgi:hypothetical protein